MVTSVPDRARGQALFDSVGPLKLPWPPPRQSVAAEKAEQLAAFGAQLLAAVRQDPSRPALIYGMGQLGERFALALAGTPKRARGKVRAVHEAILAPLLEVLQSLPPEAWAPPAAPAGPTIRLDGSIFGRAAPDAAPGGQGGQDDA